MKQSIPLSNGNDSNDDGDARNSASANASNRSDSDDSAILRLDGIIGESVAGSGSDESGDDELPIGDGGYKKSRGKRKVNRNGGAGVIDGALRIGERNDRSRRSRTNANSDNASATARTEEDASSGARSIPREVALDSLGKSKEKKEKYTPNANLSTEFIAEGFGIVFQACAILFQDDEWKLPEEDANELAERTKKWARQGSKNIAAFEKKLAKWEPMMMLIFGLFAVILPRIIHTRDKRRALRSPQKAPSAAGTSANGNRNTVSTNSSIQVVDGPTTSGNANGRAGSNQNSQQSGGANVVPFRRQDWREIPGISDG